MKALKENVSLRQKGLPFNIWIHEIYENKPCLPVETWHEFTEILYVLEGQITQKINGTAFNMSEGDLVVVNGLDLHSVFPYPNKKIKLLVIQIPPSFINFYFKESRIYIVKSNYFINSDKNMINKEIQLYMQNIINEFTIKEEAYRYYLASYIYILLATILRHTQESSINENDYIEQKLLLERISPALEFIYDNFKNNISTTDVLPIVCMCRQYFCKCFKKATTYTFIQYLNELRVLYARDMLLTSNLNITEISYSSGFSSVSYFNRIFKKFTGVNPFNFRRQ